MANSCGSVPFSSDTVFCVMSGFCFTKTQHCKKSANSFKCCNMLSFFKTKKPSLYFCWFLRVYLLPVSIVGKYHKVSPPPHTYRYGLSFDMLVVAMTKYYFYHPSCLRWHSSFVMDWLTRYEMLRKLAIWMLQFASVPIPWYRTWRQLEWDSQQKEVKQERRLCPRISWCSTGLHPLAADATQERGSGCSSVSSVESNEYMLRSTSHSDGSHLNQR